MISVSDVLKLLDGIPIWKSLKALPEKIAALEKRVSELETKLAAPLADNCPKCGSDQFKVAWSRNENQRTYICGSCKYKETRSIKP